MLDEYIKYQKDSRNIAEVSLEIYVWEIKKFLEFLGDVNILDVTPFIANKYVKHLEKQGFKWSSSRRKIACISSFYNFIFKQEKILANPFSEVIVENKDVKTEAKLEIGDLDKFLEFCEDDPKGMRDRVILEILGASNLKITEILNLKMNEIISYNEINVLLRKKIVKIHLPDDVAQDLKDFVEVYRPLLFEDENDIRVFKNISRQLFRARFLRCARMAGLKDAVPPGELNKSKKEKTLEAEPETKKRKFEELKKLYMEIGIGDD